MAVLVGAGCVAPAEGARKRLNDKVIDLAKLEEELKEGDVDDEDWHENTWEWKEKDRQKKMAAVDTGDMAAVARAAQAQVQGGGGGGLQIGVAHLKLGAAPTLKDAVFLADAWGGMLRSGGVLVMCSAVVNKTVILNMQEGDFVAAKQFVLDQAETEKFVWNQKDYYVQGPVGEARKALDAETKASKKDSQAENRARQARQKRKKEKRLAKAEKKARRSAKRAEIRADEVEDEL